MFVPGAAARIHKDPGSARSPFLKWGPSRNRGIQVPKIFAKYLPWWLVVEGSR
jgi:hypothetical protein